MEKIFIFKKSYIKITNASQNSRANVSFLPFRYSVRTPSYEINLWIPLNYPSSNEGYGFSISSLKDSIEIFEKYNFDVDKMSKDGRKDIPNLLDPISKLQNFEYGQAVLFDTRCLHSGKIMSDHTRVSIDVRITPVKLFKKFNHEYQGTGRKKTIFKPGGGYNINSIDNIEL